MSCVWNGLIRLMKKACKSLLKNKFAWNVNKKMSFESGCWANQSSFFISYFVTGLCCGSPM